MLKVYRMVISKMEFRLGGTLPIKLNKPPVCAKSKVYGVDWRVGGTPHISSNIPLSSILNNFAQREVLESKLVIF